MGCSKEITIISQLVKWLFSQEKKRKSTYPNLLSSKRGLWAARYLRIVSSSLGMGSLSEAQWELLPEELALMAGEDIMHH